MSQRNYRMHSYAALAAELESWRQLPAAELIARVGQPPTCWEIEVEGETFALEISASWANGKRDAIQLDATARGSSHLQIERLDESLVVRLQPSAR